jgi:NADH-quinone oxidoreductase subunit C
VTDQVEAGRGRGEGGDSVATDTARARSTIDDAHPTVQALAEEFGGAILRHVVSAGNEHVVYVEAARAGEILAWLKEAPSQRYDLLRDVTAVDYGGGRPLEVVYVLWSVPHRRSLRVKCELPIAELAVSSVTPLWQSANWLEREVYDMFGVEFKGHPDLRRILMPENYAEGHPLRKDFPLRGRFSRAEQTRRALSQDPRDHYIPTEMEIGEPQMAEGARPTRPDLPPASSVSEEGASE